MFIQYLILFSILAFGYGYAEVDYWGISQQEKQIKVEKHKMEKQKEPKRITKKEKISPEQLVEESKKWYLKKLKKEKPPIEYYYFTNPEKYADEYWRWLLWKQEKGNELVNPTIVRARAGNIKIDKIVQILKDKNVQVLFFYSPTCPYCQASEPEVNRIENYLKVYRIDITKDRQTALKWNINTTPTFIAVSPLERKAFRIVGYQPYTQIIYQIYKKFVEEK